MMMWLWRTVVGCFGCKFAEVKCTRVNYEGQYIGDEYILRCEKCGRMKQYKFTA